jgi:hypothetical protein
MTAFASHRRRLGPLPLRFAAIRQVRVPRQHPRRPTAFRRQFGGFRQHAIPSPLP